MVSSRKSSGNGKPQATRATSVSQARATLPPKPAFEKRTRSSPSASNIPPQVRPSDQERTRAQRSWGRRSASWTPEEDAKLVELVNKESATPPSITASKTWSRVAAQLTKRTGKQCRERYLNQLKPGIRRDPWTAEEERILREAHARLGNKWVAIANQLPGRTDNCVKNHWNSMLRKRQRREAALKAAQAEASAAVSDPPPSCSDMDRRSEAENSTRTGCASPSGVSSSHYDVPTPGTASPYNLCSPHVPHRDSKLQISTLVASYTKEFPVWHTPYNTSDMMRSPFVRLNRSKETENVTDHALTVRNQQSCDDRNGQSSLSTQNKRRSAPAIPLAINLPSDTSGLLPGCSSMPLATTKFLSHNMSPMQCIGASPRIPQVMRIANSADSNSPGLPSGPQLRRSSRLLAANSKGRPAGLSKDSTARPTQRQGINKPRYRRDTSGTTGLAALAAAASSMPPSPVTPESRFSGTTRSRSVSPGPRILSRQKEIVDNQAQSLGFHIRRSDMQAVNMPKRVTSRDESAEVVDNRNKGSTNSKHCS